MSVRRSRLGVCATLAVLAGCAPTGGGDPPCAALPNSILLPLPAGEVDTPRALPVARGSEFDVLVHSGSTVHLPLSATVVAEDPPSSIVATVSGDSASAPAPFAYAGDAEAVPAAGDALVAWSEPTAEHLLAISGWRWNGFSVSLVTYTKLFRSSFGSSEVTLCGPSSAWTDGFGSCTVPCGRNPVSLKPLGERVYAGVTCGGFFGYGGNDCAKRAGLFAAIWTPENDCSESAMPARVLPNPAAWPAWALFWRDLPCIAATQLLAVEDRLFLVQGIGENSGGLVAREIDLATVEPLGDIIELVNDGGVWVPLAAADRSDRGALLAYRFDREALEGEEELLADLVVLGVDASSGLSVPWQRTLARLSPSCFDQPSLVLADEDILAAWSSAGRMHVATLDDGGREADAVCFDGVVGGRLASAGDVVLLTLTTSESEPRATYLRRP